jgi:hypothetical protein
VFKPDVFYHFHEADQACIQQWRKRLDFSINEMTEGFDRPLHKRYIAWTLYMLK